MIIAIGIDVHKEKCAAKAVFAGKGEPRPKHLEFLKKFNEDFRRFGSDYKGMTELADRLRDHEAHILIENSTKSHDVYWMLNGLGLDVTVAHATDLVNITKSTNKNDDNDADKLAHYMRRKLWGEKEFAICHIPDRETLLNREICRFFFCLHEDLGNLKRQIHAHLLIRGWKLTKNYGNIACQRALRELKTSGIDILILDAVKAEYLKKMIFETERLIRYRMRSDPIFSAIWNIPGFGISSTSYTTCMIDDISRFENGRDFAASIGLTPKLHESADKPTNCGISRRGDPQMRKVICQATFVHIFHADSPITQKYNRLLERGKSHREALTACSNSMARIVWKVAKTKERYVSDPEALAKARAMADSEDLEEEMEGRF